MSEKIKNLVPGDDDLLCLSVGEVAIDGGENARRSLEREAVEVHGRVSESNLTARVWKNGEEEEGVGVFKWMKIIGD
ncbi:hypothetical protein TIFTF001_011608 [Ficus carica]|uniref:Uncharacterized protein n=1 Tax=Ficus carica TaxID=3494 RepID=A0AA88DHX2_FICCA|nr:hypothetical protein TIFTF001_011608 [Ficus carica]